MLCMCIPQGSLTASQGPGNVLHGDQIWFSTECSFMCRSLLWAWLKGPGRLKQKEKKVESLTVPILSTAFQNTEICTFTAKFFGLDLALSFPEDL